MTPDQPHPDDSSTMPASPPSYRWPLAIAVFVAIVVLALRSNFPTRSPKDGPGVGAPAPTIELVRLTPGASDVDVRIPSHRVTVLHFWGTWCGPCQMEYPHLDKAMRTLKTEGPVEFVSVSCESGSETIEKLAKKTQEYLESIHADQATYADPTGATRRNTAKRLQQSNVFYPTTLVIDQQGVIRGVWEGYEPHGVDQMSELIRELWSDGGE